MKNPTFHKLTFRPMGIFVIKYNLVSYIENINRGRFFFSERFSISGHKRKSLNICRHNYYVYHLGLGRGTFSPAIHTEN